MEVFAQEKVVTVRIRLKRMGRRHKPSYRVAVVDGRRARDSKVIEELGSFDPTLSDESRQTVLKDAQQEKTPFHSPGPRLSPFDGDRWSPLRAGLGWD